jgi:signal transduction histidine kinase
MASFDVTKVLEEIEVTTGADVAARGLALDVRAEASLEIDADRHMIISAFANLVQNAIKFTPRGGTVSVRACSSPGEMIAVEVEDQCGGLPPGRAEELAHPTPFHTDPDGVGLGLVIVHQAVRLHRGQLGVTDLPGRGCIFTIVLPRARQGGPRDDETGELGAFEERTPDES